MRCQLGRPTAAGLAVCLLLGGSGLAVGEQPARPRGSEAQARQETAVRSSARVRRGSMVLGASVTLEQGAPVGKVEDFVLSESGCLEYLVVSYEDKFILVPWAAATVSFDRHVVRLDITRDRWREVPTFAKDHWPNLSDRQYTQKLYSSFGIEGGRRGRRTEPRAATDTERRGAERAGTAPRTEQGNSEQKPDQARPPADNRTPPSEARPPADNRQPSAAPPTGPTARPPGDQGPGVRPTTPGAPGTLPSQEQRRPPERQP